MPPSGPPTMRIVFSRLLSASMFFCALTFLSLPHHAVLALVELSEAECPLHEEGESSKEELVVRSPVRHRPEYRFQRDQTLARNSWGYFLQNTSSAARLSAIVGHQLANGHSAPLLI